MENIKIPKQVKRFIKYETARVCGRWNMITQGYEVAKHLGWGIIYYKWTIAHYEQLHDEAEKFRAKSPEHENIYTAHFTIELALREPAPF